MSLDVLNRYGIERPKDNKLADSLKYSVDEKSGLMFSVEIDAEAEEFTRKANNEAKQKLETQGKKAGLPIRRKSRKITITLSKKKRRLKNTRVSIG